MTTHVVALIYTYREDDHPEITDRESAVKAAMKDMEENPPLEFEFDYEVR